MPDSTRLLADKNRDLITIAYPGAPALLSSDRPVVAALEGKQAVIFASA